MSERGEVTCSLDSTANRPRATTPDRLLSWRTQDGEEEGGEDDACVI